MPQQRSVPALTAQMLAAVGVLCLCIVGFAAVVARTSATEAAGTQRFVPTATVLVPNAFFADMAEGDHPEDSLSPADDVDAVSSGTAQMVGVLENSPSDPTTVSGSEVVEEATPTPTLPPATATQVPPAASTAVPTAVPATATPEPPAVSTAVPTAVAATATAVPTTAPTPTPVPTANYEQRGQAVLATLPFAWQELGYAITFHPPRDGYRGLTFPYENRIEIYVDPQISDFDLAHVMAHEIGHVVDVVRNTGDDRQQWLAARGVSTSTRWWAGDGVSDFASGSGDFAECFAAWQVGSPSYSRLAGSCDGTAALVARLAAS